jgi:hypothetical protein
MGLLTTTAGMLGQQQAVLLHQAERVALETLIRRRKVGQALA